LQNIIRAEINVGGILGADEIVMTDLSEISPIDPSTANVFNPSDPQNPQNMHHHKVCKLYPEKNYTREILLRSMPFLGISDQQFLR